MPKATRFQSNSIQINPLPEQKKPYHKANPLEAARRHKRLKLESKSLQKSNDWDALSDL